jgi:hypothetical protein
MISTNKYPLKQMPPRVTKFDKKQGSIPINSNPFILFISFTHYNK